MKTLKTCGLVLLIVVLIMAPLVSAFFYSETRLYQDYRERAEFAGTLDYLTIGASHAERGFIPAVLDEKLGVTSYNLGYALMSMQGRLELLKLEVSRNPVKTVIMELSMDTMAYNPNTQPLEGDMYMIARLGSVPRGFSYLLRSFRPWHYPWLFYRYVHYGLETGEMLLKGTYSTRNVNQKKGYVPHYDATIVQGKTSLKKLKRIYHTDVRRPNVWEGNRRYLQQIIDFCKEKEIELVLVTLPNSEYTVARYSNLNDNYSYYRQVAEENGLPFFDFNLHHDKTRLLPDDVGFTDKSHLSNIGAEVFTDMFIETYRKLVGGGDPWEDFYEDYPAMYAEQPYAQ